VAVASVNLEEGSEVWLQYSRSLGHPDLEALQNRNQHLSTFQRVFVETKANVFPSDHCHLQKRMAKPMRPHQAGHWPEARVAQSQACTNVLIRLRSIRQAIQPTPARRTGNRKNRSRCESARKFKAVASSGPGARSTSATDRSQTRGWNGPSTLKSEGSFSKKKKKKKKIFI